MTSGGCIQEGYYFTVVPHGWRRELDEHGDIYYLSPDLRKLSSSEELLQYLTTDGTCKCGLRCPFHLEQQFSFNPAVISLVDCHPSQHDSTPHLADPQSFCKATHPHHPSPSHNSPQHKQQQINFSPSIRLTRSSAASKYMRESHHHMYSLTPPNGGDSSAVVTAGQKRPALVANLNLANTSAKGKSKRIKMDSTSTVLNYNNTSDSTTNGGGKSSQHQSQQVHHRINGHSQRIQGCTTISINPNTNNNSSSSFKQPPSITTTSTCTLTTNGANSNGVLHLIPGSSSAAQPMFVLDEDSQQQFLSLLVACSGDGGYGGDVVTCSLAADGNVLVAAMNDRLEVQQQSCAEVQVSETVLCKNESSTCSSVQEEHVVVDQTSNSGNKIDNTRSFAHVRDMGESFYADPLTFLASAAEEVKSMMESAEISSNYQRYERKREELRSTQTSYNRDTNEEGHEGQVGQLRLIGTNTSACSSVGANEKQSPQNDAEKETNTAGRLHILQESTDDSLLSLVSAISQAPSLLSTEEQIETSLQSSELPALESDAISSLEGEKEGMDYVDVLSEAKLVDEGLMNLLQRAVDLEGAQSELFTPGEENLMEYCLKMVDEQVSSNPELAQSANLAVMDELEMNENSSLEMPPTPVIGIVRDGEENAESADLAVVYKDQEVEGNETTELELPAAPFNNDIHDLNSLELNAQSTDSAVISTVSAPKLCIPLTDDTSSVGTHKDNIQSADLSVHQPVEMGRNGDSPSSLSSHETDDAGPCPFDLTSLTSDEAQCPQSRSPVSDSDVESQSSMMHEGRTSACSTSSKVFDNEMEQVNLHVAASEEPAQEIEGKLNSSEDHSHFKEDNSKMGVQPEVQLLSTISSNILSDQKTRVYEELMDIASPLPAAIAPQPQVSDSLANEDHCNTSSGAKNLSLDDEDLNVDEKQHSILVDQCSPTENRVCMQVSVNFSPPISDSDMGAKLCKKESEKPSTVDAPSSPILHTSHSLSATSSTQSQASTSSGASVDNGQKFCTDLEQHLDSVREQTHCKNDAKPCLLLGAVTTLSSTISDGVSKDQNITEDDSPSPISTVTSQTVDLLNQDGNNTSVSTGATLALSEWLRYGIEQKPVVNEEKALTDNIEEMDAQSGVNHPKVFTDISHRAESMESTIPLGADHELKTQLISVEKRKVREEGESQSGTNEIKESASVVGLGEANLSMSIGKSGYLEESDRHGSMKEVNGQSGVNNVTESQSVESDICVPLIPELLPPFCLVKEQSQSDDAEEMDDCTDSIHTTKLTDTQWAESANRVYSELEQRLVPFKEHPQSSDHNRDNTDDQSIENQPIESTCARTAQTVAGVPTHSTSTDIPTNACIELKGDHEHEHNIDVDLPPSSDLTTEVCDQIEDDRSSSTSGIITTSACFRKEWSDTNSDTQSSNTSGLLSCSGSYGLSNSFSSCDQYSLGDSTRSSASDGMPERVFDIHRENNSNEKFAERPSSLSSSSFRRKKTWDSGFYAASKIIMTRSKFADLRRIGDDFMISQAFTCPFHDISGESFGSGSPDDEECLTKIAGHRSLSVSSMESAGSSVCSLDDAGASSSASTCSLSSTLSPDCPYQVGDIVWAKAPKMMGWPGIVISHTQRKKDKLTKPPHGKVWVQWIGHSTVSLVELTAVKPLNEGIKHRTKYGKKMPKKLQESINQALKLLKKQQRNKSVVKR